MRLASDRNEVGKKQELLDGEIAHKQASIRWGGDRQTGQQAGLAG